jgi:hypothetical protein
LEQHIFLVKVELYFRAIKTKKYIRNEISDVPITLFFSKDFILFLDCSKRFKVYNQLANY